MERLDLNVGVENLAATVADFQEFFVCDGHCVCSVGGDL
jgi:hypothetical protein